MQPRTFRRGDIPEEAEVIEARPSRGGRASRVVDQDDQGFNSDQWIVRLDSIFKSLASMYQGYLIQSGVVVTDESIAAAAGGDDQVDQGHQVDQGRGLPRDAGDRIFESLLGELESIPGYETLTIGQVLPLLRLSRDKVIAGIDAALVEMQK